MKICTRKKYIETQLNQYISEPLPKFIKKIQMISQLKILSALFNLLKLITPKYFNFEYFCNLMHEFRLDFNFLSVINYAKDDAPPIDPNDYHWYFCLLEFDVIDRIQQEYYNSYKQYGDQDLVSKNEVSDIIKFSLTMDKEWPYRVFKHWFPNIS
jgi:hypothetical protein